MSNLSNAEQLEAMEHSVDAFEAQMEALTLEFNQDDVIDDAEQRELDRVAAKIDSLKEQVAALRKTIEKNKALWERSEKRHKAFQDKVSALVAFPHRGGPGAQEHAEEIATAAAEERWGDALAALEAGEADIADDWADYEKVADEKPRCEFLVADLDNRLKAVRAKVDAEAEETEEWAARHVALAIILSKRADIELAMIGVKYGEAIDLAKEAMAKLAELETEIGGTPATAANLSGKAWYNANQSKHPNSTKLSDLDSSFQSDVKDFKKALEEAGVKTKVSCTKRPTSRAYIMHYAYQVAKGKMAPGDVPAISGVDINWDHGDAAVSVGKAQEMLNPDCFDIVHEPSKTSNHTRGTAIDWTLTWSGDLSIKKKGEEEAVEITSAPRNGTNADLHPVGASYGVHKLVGDAPHWSHNGN